MIEGLWQEMECCYDAQHIASMHEAMERGFDRWFARFADEAAVGGARFQRRQSGRRLRGAVSGEASRLAQCAAEAVQDYRKARGRYYDPFLDPECLEEFEDDPRAFAMGALREIPVIHKAVYSDLDEMTRWKRRFCALLKQRPRLFHHLVNDLVQFAGEYAALHDPAAFGTSRDPFSLGLEPVERVEPDGDDAMPMGSGGGAATMTCLSVPGIVGLGITSMLLFYREPAFFAARSRHALAAMYFLCGGETGGLESSEFLLWMPRGGQNVLAHNYAYPYRLFTVHTLAVARLMEGAFAERGERFDTAHRMVLAGRFLSFIADANAGEIASWREVPDA